MSRLVNFLWGLSFFAFLVAFLFVYAYAPEQMAVITDPESNSEVMISRNSFFYFGIGIFIMWNAIVLVFAKLLEMMTVGEGRFFSHHEFKVNLINWVYSFSVIVNTCFILMTLFLSFYNSTESRDMSNADIVLYVGPALLVVWILLLGYIFVKRK